MIGIYKITNNESGKVYIGQSIHIEQRWREHLCLLKKGIHHSSKLQLAFDRYGAESFAFDVLEEVVDRKDLDKYEDLWIKAYNSVNRGYNMVETYHFANNSKSKNEKLKMRNEEYNVMTELIDLFNGNLSIVQKTYHDRVMNKHYQYKQYKTINRLISIMYQNYYRIGDKVEVDVLFGKNRIRNTSTDVTIMFNKESNVVNVWNGDKSLSHDTCIGIKVGDLI